MARLQLNKSALAREKSQLATYERFLPSLDLKRKQLMAARAAARAAAAEADREVEDLVRRAGRELPMLADEEIALDGLVRVSEVELAEENVVGTKLPRLARIEVEAAPYSIFAKPHWVDAAVALLRDLLEARVKAQVAHRRVRLLEAAVATITQRVNLFDNVLIPTARSNIKRIRTGLNEQEMQSVVRSKIAKRKRAAR